MKHIDGISLDKFKNRMCAAIDHETIDGYDEISSKRKSEIHISCFLLADWVEWLNLLSLSMIY